VHACLRSPSVHGRDAFRGERRLHVRAGRTTAAFWIR